jgi:hypothetical protein
MFKKLCLTSVSATVFLSALSIITPSYGMDEKVKENRNEETPSQKQITVKPIEALNKKEKCFFLNFPNGVAQKIFLDLDPKSEANTRLVCTKWRFLCDTNPGSLRVSFDSGKAWELEPEEFIPLLLSYNVLFFRILDHLDPLVSPDTIYSLKGKILEKIKLTPQERLLQLCNELQSLIVDAPKAREEIIDSSEFHHTIIKFMDTTQKIIYKASDFDKNNKELQKFIVILQNAMEGTVNHEIFHNELQNLMIAAQKVDLLTKTEEIDSFNFHYEFQMLMGTTQEVIGKRISEFESNKELHTLLLSMQKIKEGTDGRFKFFDDLQMLMKNAANMNGYIKKTIHQLDPIIFPDNASQTRMSKKLELQKKFRDVMISTGKTLGFLEKNCNFEEYDYVSNPFNFETFLEVRKDTQNHPSLHRFLKSLWLLNQCQDGIESLEMNSLTDFTSKFKNLSYWSAYTNDSAI